MKAIIGKKEIQIELQKGGKGILLDGKIIDADFAQINEKLFHVLHQNKSYTARILEVNLLEKNFVIKVNSTVYSISLKDKYDDLLHALGMDASLNQKINNLKAPMPGLVLDVLVAENQQVKKGESLVVLEAMKMENILKSAADGMIKRIYINKGARVEKNELMIEFA